jgi:hypothetical protein
MNLEQFLALSSTEQGELSLRAAGREREPVGWEFLRRYRHRMIARVIVDAHVIGALPHVCVEFRTGRERLRLPGEFMGCAVIRRYLATGKLV